MLVVILAIAKVAVRAAAAAAESGDVDDGVDDGTSTSIASYSLKNLRNSTVVYCRYLSSALLPEQRLVTLSYPKRPVRAYSFGAGPGGLSCASGRGRVHS